MAREMVTVRVLDAAGELVQVEQRELMVRRPRGKASYAAFPDSKGKRHLVSDNPPVIESHPPRVVQSVNLRDRITQRAAEAAADGHQLRGRVVGTFDDGAPH